MKKRRVFSAVPLLPGLIAALALMLSSCASASDRDLIAAVKEGDADRVKTLLESGANPNFKDIKGWTALMYMYAADETNWRTNPVNNTVYLRLGDRKINKLLLDAGADPNIKNRDGDTALIILSRDANPAYAATRRLVKMFSKRGADLDIRNKDGNTALIEMMSGRGGGLQDAVSALLECGANPDIQDSFGRTALMDAAFHYKTKAARVLLDWGANPALRDSNGATALTLAYSKTQFDKTQFDKKIARLVKMLIDAGADPNDIQDRDALAALLERCEKENIETARQLLESEEQYALIEAASDDNMDVVKLLLENRAVNVNAIAKGDWTETALQCAVKNYNAKMISLLLSAGANPNEAGLATPALQDAVQEGYAEGVRLLLESGANPNVRNSEGRTALMAVARYAPVLDAECIRMLFRAGANPNLKDEEGLTALMRAVLREEPEPELVRLLLEGGANPDIQMADGGTVLLLATLKNNAELVRLLLDAGANPNIQITKGEYEGLTALMAAAISGNTEVARLLLDVGANPNLSLPDGVTALSLATVQGHTAVADMLRNAGARQ